MRGTPARTAHSTWAGPTHNSSNPPSPSNCQMGVSPNAQPVQENEITNCRQTWTRAVDRGPSSRSGPPHASRYDTTLTGDQGWERGKRASTLDAALLDQDWENVMPHQRTPVNAGCLLGLLVEAGYDRDKTSYLVDGFRLGFYLRLDRPIHQLVNDRLANIRTVKGNNKTALINPRAVEEKLTKEHRAKRMIGPFLRPIFPAYVISPMGFRAKKVPGKFRVIHDLSSPFEGCQ